ncbi:hypothetical protein [Chitinivibrio alkaliphilus]|uniref:Uncharacterized protein n=1 Tax=Chitinivibrio alkaliphilus ACht1 TaxID=1313304 RepID=U7D8S5_9BACT|nr:hypothetical protein [Chitinivibrio alkaliphilus]ERP31981.1 hypothetical protein CALK_0958 [Chitinivibrio alkaliphilus ACht1]
MRIGHTAAAQYNYHRGRGTNSPAENKSVSKNKSSRNVRRDTYEGGKAGSLNEVQKRIKNDFYNSDVVNEDLSEVFSKLFDQKL